MDTRSSVTTRQKNFQRATIATLRKRQRTIGKRLRAFPSQLIRGSLITRYTRCGKLRCRCVTGRGHGPKYYLSVSNAGRRPTLIYVPLAMVAQVQEQLAQFRKVRTLVEELCHIGCELLTRRAGR